MPIEKNIKFIVNPLAVDEPARYVTVNIRVDAALKSWRDSLFSFEWLTPDGRIKTLEELSDIEKPKRQQAEKLLQDKADILMPVLGIGILDNIEIGSGRAEFLTLAAQGAEIIPVHIPKSCESDFKPFLADVKSGNGK